MFDARENSLENVSPPLTFLSWKAFVKWLNEWMIELESWESIQLWFTSTCCQLKFTAKLSLFFLLLRPTVAQKNSLFFASRIDFRFSECHREERRTTKRQLRINQANFALLALRIIASMETFLSSLSKPQDDFKIDSKGNLIAAEEEEKWGS